MPPSTGMPPLQNEELTDWTPHHERNSACPVFTPNWKAVLEQKQSIMARGLDILWETIIERPPQR